MLTERVLAFIARARQSPVLASDPKFLDDLEQAAQHSSEGEVAALHAPVAPYTYEARILMLGATLESERQPLRIPFESVIVGMRANIASVTFPHVTVPTLADIDCALDIDDTRDILTIAKGVTSSGSNEKDGSFVTLDTLDVQTPRLHRVVLDKLNNEVGVKFRWKAGVGHFDDCIITLAFFVRPLRGKGRPASPTR